MEEKKKASGWSNLNGISDDDKTCGLNDMNCLEDEKDTSCGLNDMNCLSGENECRRKRRNQPRNRQP